MATSSSDVGDDVSQKPAQAQGLSPLSDSEGDDRSTAGAVAFGATIDDKDLLDLDIKDLNRLLKQLNKEQQAAVKGRRRTLKNRGYAQSCRSKRQDRADNLDSRKADLEKEIKKIREELRQVETERENAKAELFQMLGINNQVSREQLRSQLMAAKDSIQQQQQQQQQQQRFR